ncbi:MAG: hypothetical protein JXO51_00265 [Candidatus Aminicenantes bacterium]|nr:hypothetical protein [Candidatus Aminicenantes bacterium]
MEELFGSKAELNRLVKKTEELPVIRSKVGAIIGGEESIDRAQRLTERRSGRESIERRRSRGKYFEPVEKVVGEFERMHGVDMDKLDMSTHAGKRLRAELLVGLRARGGMSYREIVKMDLFADIGMSSLGTLYRRSKRRLHAGKGAMQHNCQNDKVRPQ